MSDKQKRNIFDQLGEEGLKGGGGMGGGGGGAGAGGFPGGFPGGASFSFSSSGGGPGGGFSGFRPSDANDIFRQFFGSMGGGRGGGGMFNFGGGGGGGDSDDEGMGGNGGGMGGHPFASMFQQMGGGAGGMGGMGGGTPRGPKKAEAIKHKITLSLEDLYTGITKKMKITKTRTDANGRSESIPKVIEIPIKRGYKAGTKLTYEREGDERPGVIPADIIFEIEEAPHPRFKRKGDDLIHTRPISLTQALTGTRFNVVGIDGSNIEVDTTADGVIAPGQHKLIRGKGMVNSKTGGYGDLIIEFEVVFPKGAKLTQEQKQKIVEAKLP